MKDSAFFNPFQSAAPRDIGCNLILPVHGIGHRILFHIDLKDNVRQLRKQNFAPVGIFLKFLIGVRLLIDPDKNCLYPHLASGIPDRFHIGRNEDYPPVFAVDMIGGIPVSSLQRDVQNIFPEPFPLLWNDKLCKIRLFLHRQLFFGISYQFRKDIIGRIDFKVSGCTETA